MRRFAAFLLIFASTPSWAAISYISQQSADSNTLTMPTHTTDDLILGFGSREGSETPPTVPVGWVVISSGGSGGENIGTSVAYKIATSGSETFGTWTNAQGVAVHVYRGASGIGNQSINSSGGSSVDYPALTLNVGDSTSWVALFCGHAWGGGATLNAPSSYSNRSNNAGASHTVGGHDSNGGVASYAGTNGTMTSGGFDSYSARAIEILGPTFTSEQEGFSFGDDDGNEASHTLDSQDTNVTEPLGVKTIRTLVNLTGTGSSITPSLRYQKNGSGGYTAVSTNSITVGFTGAIETGDLTDSGNNTASTSWPISVPSASAGDLIIINLAWDDSTTTTEVAISSGKAGEIPTTLLGPVTPTGTGIRSKAWYFVTSGAWTAGTVITTPTASEQWTATVIKIPAGEFDSSVPIGVSGSSVSVGSDGRPGVPALNAGASDGGGRLVAWIAGDGDNPDSNNANWTPVNSVDRGAVGAGISTRNDYVTDSEVITSTSGWTFPAIQGWATISYVVRPPADVTNQVYISASANVASGGEATTARLSAPSGKSTSDFDTGRRWDDENGLDAVAIGDDEYTEYEWILTAQSPAADTDYFEFRTYINGAAANTYTVTPKWTIGTEGGGAVATPARRRIIFSE